MISLYLHYKLASLAIGAVLVVGALFGAALSHVVNPKDPA